MAFNNIINFTKSSSLSSSTQSYQQGFYDPLNFATISFAVNGSIGGSNWTVSNLQVVIINYFYTISRMCESSCPIWMVALDNVYASFCVSCTEITGEGNQVYDQGSGLCGCPPATYQSIQGCAPCGRRCLECGNLVSCSLCSDGMRPTDPSFCPCAPNQYMNAGGDCITCPYTCLTC